MIYIFKLIAPTTDKSENVIKHKDKNNNVELQCTNCDRFVTINGRRKKFFSIDAFLPGFCDLMNIPTKYQYIKIFHGRMHR